MSTAAEKPTVVFIPGAWHRPSPTYDPVIALLNKSGYPTISITLPSVGSAATFVDDVATIRSAIVPVVEEQGKEVVVVVHSYGGCPGTEAVQGLAKAIREKEGKKGGVIRLVYIAAMVPVPGESGNEVLRRTMEKSRESGIVVPMAPSELQFTVDGLVIILTAVDRFYNDLDPDWATELSKGLLGFNVDAFNGKLTYGAYPEIPSAYLICMNDQAIGWKAQEVMAKEAESDIVERVESGHTPMLVMPDAVASFIRRAAGEKLLAAV